MLGIMRGVCIHLTTQGRERLIFKNKMKKKIKNLHNTHTNLHNQNFSNSIKGMIYWQSSCSNFYLVNWSGPWVGKAFQTMHLQL